MGFTAEGVPYCPYLCGMNREQLVDLIWRKRSYLCVGLDTDINKLPATIEPTTAGMLSFNKQIIDATRDYAVAYKINAAFYEAQGLDGWKVMEETVRYIGDEQFTIADAKRGDIGNTADQYAKAFFEKLPFDSVTVAPYMGKDSVQPFLAHKDKWAIVLGLTSNAGATDFELLKLEASGNKPSRYLYEEVLEKTAAWGNTGNLMFVIGATQAAQFTRIREITPEHFYLVPGVGAQGGSLKEISERAMIKDAGLLVNASRAIQYASSNADFADKARQAAAAYQEEMSAYLPR